MGVAVRQPLTAPTNVVPLPVRRQTAILGHRGARSRNRNRTVQGGIRHQMNVLTCVEGMIPADDNN